MFGAGSWEKQDKVLPGTYVNKTALKKADTKLSERGYVAVPLELDWGPEKAIFTVTKEDFKDKCFEIFGCASTHDKMLPLRELFKNASVAYIYRLNSSGGKASCTYATAKYAGTAGNDIKIVIAANVDEASKFDVSTYVGIFKVDEQTVSEASELKENGFVEFADVALTATAGTPLTGGYNGGVDGAAYQDFLDKAEKYSFNVLCCPSVDETVIALFENYTKRMVDEEGANFQTVIFDEFSEFGDAQEFDHEGIIVLGTAVKESKVINRNISLLDDAEVVKDAYASDEPTVTANLLSCTAANATVKVTGNVKFKASFDTENNASIRVDGKYLSAKKSASDNTWVFEYEGKVTESVYMSVNMCGLTFEYFTVEAPMYGKETLIYWAAGAQAGCPVSGSLSNVVYDGELSPICDLTEAALKKYIKCGYFMLHDVGDEMRVLDDINSLITYTEKKSEDFSSNQVMRAVNNLANDTAALFNNRYAGKVPNDDPGRADFWNDIIKILDEYVRLRVLESYDKAKVIVAPGDKKKAITLTFGELKFLVAMSQCYVSIFMS